MEGVGGGGGPTVPSQENVVFLGLSLLLIVNRYSNSFFYLYSCEVIVSDLLTERLLFQRYLWEVTQNPYNGKGQLWLHQYSRIIIDVHKCSLFISFISISFPLMFNLVFPQA